MPQPSLTAQEQNLIAFYDGKLQYNSPTTDGELDTVMTAVALPPIPPGSTFLDAGCGTGLACRWAARQKLQYTGIDYSSARIARARALHPDYPAAEFICQDIYTFLPACDSQAFYLSFCSEVLEHLAHPEIVWEELKRVSRICVATVPVNMPATAHLQIYPDEQAVRKAFPGITKLCVQSLPVRQQTPKGPGKVRRFRKYFCFRT